MCTDMRCLDPEYLAGLHPTCLDISDVYLVSRHRIFFLMQVGLQDQVVARRGHLV